jgi:hypothetical protein
MKSKASELSPLFRSETQGRILARLLGEPDREFVLADLAAFAGASQPTIWRECVRAERANIITQRKVGRSIAFKANPLHPFYKAMRQLLVGAFGAPTVIADVFGSIPGLDAIVLFGSWVERYQGIPGRRPEDVDVLLLGRDVARDQVFDAEARAEQSLGIPVQATLRPATAWTQPDPFMQQVQARPYMPLYVNNDADTLGELRKRMETAA